MAMQLAGLAEQDGPALDLLGVRPASLDSCLTRLPERHAAQARAQGFKAEAGEIALLSGADGLEAALLGLGLGPALHGFGAAAHGLPPGSLWRIAHSANPRDASAAETEDATLGFLLGAYRFHQLKTTALRRCAALAPGSVSRRSLILAESICAARDLINTPANLLGPAELAQAGLNLGLRFGAALEHIRGTALDARYPAMAAVGAGSDRAPEAVVLTWRGSEAAADAPLVSLCGKGVCFDTGGYDLKPSAAMLRMKKDMGGAAILLGLTQAIMSLDLPIRLQLRIGCVENSVSGGAMRPSDVLHTQAGLSVEVGNTDAEGRLVLCDLLAEAAQEQPDWLIDAATLTGAARVALGPDLPALFCTNDELAEMIVSAGLLVHDPLWRLPLHTGYDSWLDSSVADLNTVAAKPMAGAIIAALFLKHFVPTPTAWAHIDVYAWNDANRPARPEGGEAQGLRALLAAIEGFGQRRNR
jgi:leucyl aminopeptidase